MTRDEAYNRIDAIIAKYEIDDEYVTITNSKDYDALRMARELLEQEPCEDCISRQYLVEKATSWKTHFTDSERCVSLTDIQNAPPVKPTEKVGHWIPVSERLPEAGKYVGSVAKYYLVQNEYGDMLVARYTHSGYWEQIYQLKPYADEIVAWMPLPEPYKASPTGAEKE